MVAPLFGDGAAAAVVGPEGAGQIGPIALAADGGLGGVISARVDDRTLRMDGTSTFKIAVTRLSESIAQAVDAAGWRLDEVDLFVPHQANAVVAGGSEAALTPLVSAMFGALGALSKTGISRPFDARRDGFVMGEGAAILVLEDEARAIARGAPILARVSGYGACSDAHHLTAPDAQGAGAARAIEQALRDAGATPDDVVYVNAHGTSTPLNDRAETKAIKAALGERARSVPVSSTKSAIGHLLGAAGAAEAVATILALRDGTAPPTLSHEQPEEVLDLDYVPGAAKPLPAAADGRRLALSNSFGFGGHNVVLAFEAVSGRGVAPLLG